jgi:integrase
MWSEVVPVQANPMSLVTVRGSSRRQQEPRSLTVEEFRKFVRLLGEPFRTIALIGVCFGLRISECLALKWSDVDWLSGKLSIERGIMRQRLDDVKTIYSGRDMSIDAEMIGVLNAWRKSTQFASENDWVFASPVKLGRQPWPYDQVWRSFLKAAESGGIGKLGTHTRHTYRSWLDAVGAPIAVQQKLMRHGDIRTTMNTYGDVVTDEMSQAHSKVVRLALSRTN